MWFNIGMAKTFGAFKRLAGGIAVSALLLAAALATSASATAQEYWAQRAEVVAELDGKFGEAPVAVGLTENGGVMELFTAEDGTTWTLVFTLPSGLSRIVSAGETWIPLPQKVKGPGV